MTISIDIPEELLQRAQKLSGGATPRDAVVQALEEFAERRGQADLIQYLGKLDGFLTQKELQEMRDAE